MDLLTTQDEVLVGDDHSAHMEPVVSNGLVPWTTKDGIQFPIRAICPDDEPLMVKFHQGLSDRTVYLRYFCSLSFATRSSHERLARICFADPARESVLVAVHTDSYTGRPNIVAVGRLNKASDGKTAELAVLVSDKYRGRGLGKELLKKLIEAGRGQRILRLTAEMLRDNIAIQSLLKRFGFRFKLDDPRVVRASLDL